MDMIVRFRARHDQFCVSCHRKIMQGEEIVAVRDKLNDMSWFFCTSCAEKGLAVKEGGGKPRGDGK